MSVTFFGYRGKYLTRRICYPSNGSFNPYVISNKETHIVNGNIFLNGGEATKKKEERNISVVCSDGREHFRNYCLSHVGKFSCAVDCFLELCFAVFKNHVQNVSRNEFFDIIHQSCIQREHLGVREIVREPVWSWLQDHCASFTTMSADAVFSDIFRTNTIGGLTDDIKSLFLIQQRNQLSCSLCSNQLVTNTNIFVLYITGPNIISTQLENYVSEAVLPTSTTLYRDSCQKHSGNISALQHFCRVYR